MATSARVSSHNNTQLPLCARLIATHNRKRRPKKKKKRKTRPNRKYIIEDIPDEAVITLTNAYNDLRLQKGY